MGLRLPGRLRGGGAAGLPRLRTCDGAATRSALTRPTPSPTRYAAARALAAAHAHPRGEGDLPPACFDGGVRQRAHPQPRPVQLPVRGQDKARALFLLHALTHNCFRAHTLRATLALT